MEMRRTDGLVCKASGCRNTRRSGKALFTFPVDEQRRHVWMKACGLTSVKTRYTLCEAHFEDQYFLNKNRKRLTWHAIPTLFPARLQAVSTPVPAQPLAVSTPAISTPAPARFLTVSTLVPARPVTVSTSLPARPVTVSTSVPARPVTVSTSVPARPVTVSTSVPARPLAVLTLAISTSAPARPLAASIPVLAASTPVPAQPLAASTPVPAQPLAASTPVPAQSMAASTSVPAQSLAAPAPVPAQSLAAPTPVPAQSLAASTPVPAQSLTAPTPVPAQSLAASTPMPAQSLTAPTNVPAQSLAASTPVPAQSLTAPTAVPAQPLAASTPGVVSVPDVQDVMEYNAVVPSPMPLKTDMDATVKDLQRQLRESTKRCKRLERNQQEKSRRIRQMRSRERQKEVATEYTRERVSPAFFLMLTSELRNRTRRPEGQRFTDDEKLLALAIQSKNQGLYSVLRRFVSMPSTETLSKFSQTVPFQPGVNAAVVSLLKQKVSSMKEAEKECTLIVNEMNLKKGVTYDGPTDTVVGHVELGELGSDAEASSHGLVFMLQGLYANWKAPVAYYLTGGNTQAPTLVTLTTAVLDAVHSTSLRVRAIVSDGAPANVSMYTRMGATESQPSISSNGRRIYTLTDPVYLLKTVRNILLTHTINSNGCDVKWQHIRYFVGADRQNPARIAPKITEAHLKPTTSQKMRASLAAQILSSTVAAGLFTYAEYGALPIDAAETGRFVLNFDRLFDSFNGATRPVKNRRSLKEYRTAMTKTSLHLQLWKDIKPWIKSLTFHRQADQRSVSSLPFQSFWVRTMTATAMLWSDLRSEGYDYLATKRLNQDALDKLFSSANNSSSNGKTSTSEKLTPALKACLVNALTGRGKGKRKGNSGADESTLLAHLRVLFGQEQATSTEEQPEPVEHDASLESPTIATVESEERSVDDVNFESLIYENG